MSDWKLVPLEPTTEMRQAVCNCHDIDHQEQIVEDYRAMLAAAPARPLTPVQEAAPELLEALKAALQLIETISPFFRDDSDFIPYDALLQITKGDVVRNARAAIAKAEGGNDE